MTYDELQQSVIQHAQADMAAAPDMWQETPSQGGSMLVDAMKGLWNEALGPALDKMIPQGAAELGHALYTGSAYVAYGATEMPLQAPQVEAPAMAPPDAAPQASYDDLKAQVAQQAPQIEPPQQEMER